MGQQYSIMVHSKEEFSVEDRDIWASVLLCNHDKVRWHFCWENGLYGTFVLSRKGLL